jgi:beta-galactosidase
VRFPDPEGKKIVAIGWSIYPSLPSWTWPGQEGKNLEVEVYSGTEKVRLYLNDKLIGEKPTTKEQESKAVFSVSYAPGTLKVVDLKGDHEVAHTVLQTAGEPAKLRLTADRKTIQANGEDLSFITIEALDSEGRLEQNSDQEVHFTIDGPGTILAVGNGDTASKEAYQGNQRALFHGRALVVIRSSREAGAIHLQTNAENLGSTEITINASTAEPRAELKE